jgi:ligand-binding sensor domain-containing protein/DNA-binding CsgD family transcriptional regulator
MFKAIPILFIILPTFCFSQLKTIGTPAIRNFYNSDYGAGTQNWDIAQDENGFMYFANNDGLLIFNGVNWDLVRVSPFSPVRSVFIDKNNNPYIGLINDFGILSTEEPGYPVFKSLKHLLPPEIGDFEDIWRIHETSDGIVFQCYKYLFLYKNGRIEIIKPQRSYHFSFQIDKRLFLHEPDLGLFELTNGKLTKLQFWDNFKDKDISAMLNTEQNQILICTPGSGIYILENEKIEKWDTPVSNFIEKNKLFSAAAISGDYFAFGTILNGLVIADSEGNIMQILNGTNGLQNSTILSSFADKDGNLWLGLDNGIDYVGINSPISYLGNPKIMGTGYCCIIFNGYLYLGTNQGLFARPFNMQNNVQPFELVNNTAGQVWSLEEFDGQLICGHNLGTFVIEDRTARKISDIEGAWKYIRLKNNPGYLLGGHYNGLVLLKQGKNGWVFDKKINGFEESCRYINQSKNDEIWISHGTKGIFKLVFEGPDAIIKSEQYSVEHGLPSKIDNKIIKFKDKLYISTVNKLYTYDEFTNSFKVSEDINGLLNIDGRIKVFEADDKGNIWFITDNETGILRQNEDFTFTKITSPFNTLRNKFVNEFEFIYPFNNENIFIGLENGFAHYTSKFPKSYSEPFSCFITKVELSYIDSIFYFNGTDSKIEMELPFRRNAFRFNFSAPFFENNAPLVFSYFLEGFSEKWSNWTSDNYKDITNLWEGEYVLKLKAKNIYDVESEVATVQFTISPPWHRSNTAYIIYVVFLLTISFLLVKFILFRIKLAKQKEIQRYEEKMRKQKEDSQHQAIIAEKEIIKLRNDKLRAEKTHQDKELANQTMGLVQKNKLLIHIADELQFIHNLIKNDSAKTKIYSLKKRIRKEIDNKQQNKIFETHFDEVHGDFFKRLNEKYPNLSPNDLRLCAFIRMNLTTQEIATILNISYRGAEISRYRLRKKLELTRDINLSTFLLGI